MLRPWFRPKRWGYGTAPATWQGWAVTAFFVLLAVAGIALIKQFVPLPIGPWRIFGPLLYLIPLLVLFWWVVDRHSGGADD